MRLVDCSEQVDRSPRGRAGAPALVAIVGGSGSGKTWLADRMEALLGGCASRLALDNFYHDRSGMDPAERARLNFDDPEAIDWPLVSRVLECLASGRGALSPSYDFSTHTRSASGVPVPAAPVVLVDGLWLLHRPEIARFFSLSIFVRCPESERLRRRIIRDGAERGRTRADVRRQFFETVAPMHRRFVEPQAALAGVVIHYPCSSGALAALHAELRRLAAGGTREEPAADAADSPSAALPMPAAAAG